MNRKMLFLGFVGVMIIIASADALTDKQKEARSGVFKALGVKKITSEEMNVYLKEIDKGDVQAAAVTEKLLNAKQKPAGKKANIGWRYDGTGVFKDVTPPLEWNLTPTGSKKNIVWTNQIPSTGASSVIVVGPNLYVCGSNFDLMCFDKKKGKLLWIKQFSPYEALTAEERSKWAPEVKKLDELAQSRDGILKGFPGMPSADYENKVKEKEKLEKQMQMIFYKLDPDRYPMSQEDGFATATPASDGENIYVWNALGITACFTPEGNINWITNSRVGNVSQEHGFHSSPLLIDGKVILFMKDYYALNAETGEPVWQSKFWDLEFASPVAIKIGGTDCFITGDGGLMRASDGKVICRGRVGHGAPTPVYGNGYIAHLYSLIWSDSKNVIYYYKMPSSPETGFTPQMKIKDLPALDKPYKETFDRMLPSPVIHEGLLYFMTVMGHIFCFDIEKGEYVYKTKLDEEEIAGSPNASRPYGCGVLASFCLANGHIFITTNIGTTFVLDVGRKFNIVKKNSIFQRIDRGWQKNVPEGIISSSFFEGNHIYYRGEKYLYCIGEPGKPFIE